MKKKSAKSKSHPTKARARKSKKPAAIKPAMLLYGLDEDNKPRAAVFAETDFKLARKAAGLSNLGAFVAKTPDARTALKGIKPGNVYASGNKFVPNISPKRFKAILTALALAPPNPAPERPKPKLPASWIAIDVGHLVIAQADDPSLGWWPCIAESVDEDMLSLRARDFPTVTVTRHRSAVALLHTPEFSPPEDMTDAAPGCPKGWATIRPEHLVLACERQKEGYWEVLVTEVAGESATLKYRDYPDLPKFTRAVSQLALLYPKAP